MKIQESRVKKMEKSIKCKVKSVFLIRIIVTQPFSLLFFRIVDNNKTREHVSAKQMIIEKCINNAKHRIEFQMKTFSGVIKKNEDFILHVVQYKSELQGEEFKVRNELDGIKIEEAAIEEIILNVEKESVALEQTDKDNELEIEKYEKQFDSFTANEKELNKLQKDLESVSNELQEKKNFASEQENSIANINSSKKELIDMCEELINKKTKLQDNLKQLEIKMEQFSTLVS